MNGADFGILGIVVSRLSALAHSHRDRPPEDEIEDTIEKLDGEERWPRH